jgi:hypothetical protein
LIAPSQHEQKKSSTPKRRKGCQDETINKHKNKWIFFFKKGDLSQFPMKQDWSSRFTVIPRNWILDIDRDTGSAVMHVGVVFSSMTGRALQQTKFQAKIKWWL